MIEPTDPIHCDELSLQGALDRVRPMMAALEKRQLLAINLDPWMAVSIARGALPGMLALRQLLAEMVKAFDLANLDLLDTYALALLQAETLHRLAVAKREELTQQFDEAFELRARLVVDTNALVQRGFIPAARLAKLCVPNGYRNVGADLLLLSGTLRDSWPKIANNTGIEFAEVEKAQQLGLQMNSALKLREQPSEEAKTAADERQRAYTLFIRAYRAVRHAVTCARFNEGDAKLIVPSLYRRRRVKRKKPAAVEAAAVEAPVVQEPIAALSPTAEAPPASPVITDPFIH